MTILRTIAPIFLGLGILASADVAHAAVCDLVILEPGDQDVVLGELLHETCFIYNNEEVCFWVSTDQLGACVIDAGGAATVTDTLACGVDTPAGDTFDLRTGDGDDRVGVLMESHTTGMPGLVEGNAMPCGSHWAIAPWPEDFDFGITARLGVGEDAFYGSPNADLVYSNTSGAGTADSAFDLLCGRDGADTLIGDRDDNKTFEEWLVGGSGDDFCEGDPGIDGSDVYDGVSSCVSGLDAAPLTATEAKECTERGNPLEW